MAVGGSKLDFCVVGIGASAGGLDALRVFFSRMPPAPGFACVVVVHLSPRHESHLVDMLQPYTQMQVSQVVTTTALEPNHVYVIPPNANLDSIDTHLRLSELEMSRAQRAPIDHFLRTLAVTHCEAAIGVILSGAGSDGALGIRQVKEHRGLTLAQDPQEAEYGSMPQSAIATGTVDLVLSVGDMAEELVNYCGTLPWAAHLGADDALSEQDAALLEKIVNEIRLRTGQEFAMYQHAAILARIKRRMRLRHVNSLEMYLEVLRARPEEPRALYEDLLLNVAEFFRDSDTVERLLQEIFARKEQGQKVRVWSIGCSSGEDAYSLAMLLIEYTARRSDDRQLQVFASEISSRVLQQARDGLYPQQIATSVSQERLERFFVREDGRYRVRQELRDIVTFATHDLFKDPPYSHLDLIVCRSLLRDLQPTLRSGVMSLFYYALEPHGMLLIDAHDEIDDSDLFVRDPDNGALLRRVGGPRRTLAFPAELKAFARGSGLRGAAPIVAETFDTATIFRRAIERYAPPSVLLDHENRVVHFSPAAARYLRIPGGELTTEIFKLLPEAVASRLRWALQNVRREQQPWESEPFLVSVDDLARRMILRVDVAKPSPRGLEFTLVVFDEAISWVTREEDNDQRPQQLHSLLSELASVRGQLAAISDAAQRGLADRERAQLDRELHEALEELEATREQLQAISEELISVDRESRQRIAALMDVSQDLQHLLESTGYATLLLDRQLRIVRFTPLAAALLGVRNKDLRRPLADLKHHLCHENLVEDLRHVAEGTQDFDNEIRSDDGRWFMVRAEPYRSALQGIAGVVVLFLDITARKNAELALRESDRRKEEFLAVLAHELRNPLAPIAAGIEVLRKLPDDSALVLRVVGTMSRQTKQLVRLVDDLLEVGRINQGKLLLQRQDVALADLVRDAAAAISPLIESLGHKLTINMPETSLVVNADAARLTQVVGNLLHNAVRYTAPGGRIDLRVRREDGEVVINVQDNGRGIAAESLAHVFEMFYQEREAVAGGTGLGIGLTLAKKLVEMHGGAITAESSGLGGGSSFSVRLPLVQRDALAAPASLGNDSAAIEQHRVLIVDDNTDAAETLRLLMRSMGSGEVLTASSGPEALKAAAHLRPDIVLLDLSMPGMDGFEVARRMRAEPWGRRALLVALTGWGQDQHRRRSLEAGFDRHMTKPADVETLRAVLQS